MDWYFDHLNKYTGNKLCNDYYLSNQEVILNAINLLIDFYNNRISQQSFLAACDNSLCSNATINILNSLIANGNADGCDALESLNAGFIQGGYFQGWVD